MKVALLLSGGVDSSVALHLLLRQGHEVTAFYLKIWLEDELAYLGNCPWEDDLAFCREVCAAAGVPLEVVPLQREYHQKVVAWAIAELEAGRTPSPDVLCNQRIKFGAFLDLLDERCGAPGKGGFERIASGHYARLGEEDGEVTLLRGVDPSKDQTYFLFQLEQRQLRRCLFPVGHLRKSEVRALAAELGLPNQARKDSQGICFLGKIPFDDFVRGHLGERPGTIRRLPGGEVLGRHRGHFLFTVGQRKGLGLHGGPFYVVRKELATDTVWICHQRDLERYRRDSFLVSQPCWIGKPLAAGDCELRVRHSPRTAAARVEPATAGLRVRLAEPDLGIAPGQVAVFYQGEICRGGGQIELPAGEGSDGEIFLADCAL
jgi:tRNA (5-methylaminomethyl-2-thiouridylate)-methyltransferase